MKVHPTAVIDASARLAPSVSVGPYCVIGEGVEIGDESTVMSHSVLSGPTRIGAHNRFFPYSSIGLDPQDLKYQGEASRLEIGDHNTFREFVTVHRGTAVGGGVTRIGDHNLIMAYCHVAHDCQLGSHIIMANGTALGGHVTLEDYVVIGAFSGVHQFCRVGRHSFVGAASVVTRDILPFSRVSDERSVALYGLNVVGLQRRGFSKDQISNLRAAFKLLSNSQLNTSQAIEAMAAKGLNSDCVQQLVEFIRTSERGVVK